MASLTLLEPPTSTDASHAAAIVREAPAFLKSQKAAFRLPYPASLLISNESLEKWASYENIVIASLQTGDYKLARVALAALTQRFGANNERIIILQGMYDEATATGENELKTILKRYDDVLQESPTMFGVQKRRITLLKSMGKTTEAITALTALLDASPTDAEAWVELADLYLAQGSIDQAVFSLEEVVLVVPNAWNIQAKLAEVLYQSSTRSDGAESVTTLSESIRRFCRSVELSEDFLRGIYGLEQATTRYLGLLSSTAVQDSTLISKQKAEKLNEFATTKLTEILRKSKTHKNWNGYEQAELDAAQALLDTHSTSVAR